MRLLGGTMRFEVVGLFHEFVIMVVCTERVSMREDVEGFSFPTLGM